jgi:hypothetical protein
VTIEALADNLWEHQEQEARSQAGVTVLLLNSRIEHTVHFDFTKIDANRELARAAFEDQLQDAKIALTIGASCKATNPPCAT